MYYSYCGDMSPIYKGADKNVKTCFRAMHTIKATQLPISIINSYFMNVLLPRIFWNILVLKWSLQINCLDWHDMWHWSSPCTTGFVDFVDLSPLFVNFWWVRMNEYFCPYLERMWVDCLRIWQFSSKDNFFAMIFVLKNENSQHTYSILFEVFT